MFAHMGGGGSGSLRAIELILINGVPKKWFILSLLGIKGKRAEL